MRWGHSFLALRVSLLGLPAAGAAVVCALTLVGFLGRWWWAFDLASHFRGQCLLAQLAFLFLAAARRRPVAGMVVAAFAAVNAVLLAPCFFGGAAQPEEPGVTLRVLTINVHTENTNYDAVLRFAQACAPDFLLVEEMNAEWERRLRPIEQQCPHGVRCPREDNFGIALYSRLPLSRAEIVWLGEAMVPSVLAQATVAGRAVGILATHPLPPVSRRYTQWRDDQLAAVPALLAAMDKPVILMGDLNTTPWSWLFRRLLRESSLRDTGRGWGIQPTWPAHVPLLRIPIDHCLVSPEFRVASRWVGPDVGSDHLPLVVDLTLPKPAAPASPRRN